nr:GSTd protein [Diaphanosoma celebensis]
MPDLYYMALSAPCRSVMMTAKAIGLPLNLKPLNLLAGEQNRPEFVRMNPEHTVPTLDDDGFYLAESRAICAYLVQKYAKNDRLYPKDPKERAIVDQRLYFDATTFYQTFSDFYYPTIFRGKGPMGDDIKKRFEDASAHLDTYLSRSKYAAGDHLTIADLCLLASAATMEAVDDRVFADRSHIRKWLDTCRSQVDCYQELNQEGANAFGQMAKVALAKNK